MNGNECALTSTCVPEEIVECLRDCVDTAAWTAWKSKYGVEAATLIVDRFGELERAFSVRDTRTAIVVDPSGRILHRGAIDNHDALRRARSNTSPHVSGAIVDVVYEDIPNATEVATSFADVVLTEAFARRTLAYPSGVVLPTIVHCPGWVSEIRARFLVSAAAPTVRVCSA